MQHLPSIRGQPFVLVGVLCMLCGCAGRTAEDIGRDDPRRDPARAVDGFVVAEGLAVTLFAAEPMLVNPTNIDVDARGRVWVTEAVNYRPDYNPHHRPQEAGDRILILEDTTGDGVADVRKVYYQGTDINAALGIAVAGSSVIVSSSPNVWRFTDEDGDDQPDRKELLFTGIGGEQDDHGVHSFVFGPGGNWLFNFGNAGAQLLDEDGKPVRDRDGRLVAATGTPFRQGMIVRLSRYYWHGVGVEVLGHNFRNPYEVAVDAFGTVWQADNDDDGNRGVRLNFVMDHGNYGYRDERTGAHWSVRRTGMHDSIPLRHWHQNDPGVVPNVLQTGAGSPTGMTMYEGTLLPAVFHNQLIHADAGPGVVRAYLLTKEGAGYSAEIMDIMTNPDDQWFRPSDVAVAPDGSLIVSDWYDATVGGNQAVDQERGRLYRLAPPGVHYVTNEPDWADEDALGRAFMSPNMATRAMAFDAEAMEGEGALGFLNSYLDEGDPRSDDPRHVARAILAMKTLELAPYHYINLALASDHADVRVAGIRLGREMRRPPVPIVRQAVNDPAPEVRREAILSLRGASEPEAADLWAALAQQHDGADRWYLEALGIGAEGQWDAYFGAWLVRIGDDWRTAAGRDIVWRARAAAAVPLLVQLVIDEPAAVRDRYFRALDFHALDHKMPWFSTVVSEADGDRATVLHRALLHLAEPSVERSAAVQAAINELLAMAPGTQEFLDVVGRFRVSSQESVLRAMALDTAATGLGREATRLLVEIHGAAAFEEALRGEAASVALERLAGIGSPDAVALLEGAALNVGLSMVLRKQAAAAMARSASGQARLLALIQAGRLSAAQVDAVRPRLLNVWDVAQRRAAEAVLGVPEDRNAEPLPPLRSLLVARGDPRRGRRAFRTHCSPCHGLRAGESPFGPPLGDIGAKLPKAALFEAILHPSAGISMGFEGVAITLRDGTVRTGYVLDDSGGAIRLRTSDGQTHQIRREEIGTQVSLELSLMPALQEQMTRAELIDLVAFLRGLPDG